MLTRLCDWLDHRTGYRKLKEALLLEHIPGGAKWRYVWGSCLAFVFMLQLITGILLMTAYSPGDSTAWGSVYFIQYEMDFGWLIRGLHHFGSQTMVVLLGLHMLQVVIAGAHLPPREINWWLGLALMAIVLGLSLTGYLLPWDQKGFFATQVATNILGNLPVAGAWLQKVLVGGPEYGHHTLTHFYALHVGVLPLTLIVLLIAHIAVFRRHGVTAPANAQGMDYFWPKQAFRDMAMCMVVFGVMLYLVVFGGHGSPIETTAPVAGEAGVGVYEQWAKAGREGRGANLDAPADPATEGYPARPEWYFLFLFQLLKYFEGDQEIIGTVVIPNAVLGLLFILPLLGFGRMRKFGHFFGILVIVMLFAAVGMLTYQAIADDRNNSDLQDQMHKAEKLARRAVQLAHHSRTGPIRTGIPEEGARQLLRADPLTQGPKLFEQHCAGCHSYTPKDSSGEFKGFVKGTFKASDLESFAGYEWIKGLLHDPGDAKYFGRTELFGMKNWKKKLDTARAKIAKTDPAAAKKQTDEEDQAFDDIAKWLAEQAKPRADRDEKKDQVGLALFMDNCASCHSIHRELKEETEDKDGKKTIVTKLSLMGAEDAPNFTDYGSQEWLRLMIMSPGNKLRHGTRNAMPAFRNLEGPGAEVHQQEFLDKHPDVPVIHLSDLDRELIIRWLTRDYRVVFGGKAISGVPAK